MEILHCQIKAIKLMTKSVVSDEQCSIILATYERFTGRENDEILSGYVHLSTTGEISGTSENQIAHELASR